MYWVFTASRSINNSVHLTKDFNGDGSPDRKIRVSTLHAGLHARYTHSKYQSPTQSSMVTQSSAYIIPCGLQHSRCVIYHSPTSILLHAIYVSNAIYVWYQRNISVSNATYVWYINAIYQSQFTQSQFWNIYWQSHKNGVTRMESSLHNVFKLHAAWEKGQAGLHHSARRSGTVTPVTRNDYCIDRHKRLVSYRGSTLVGRNNMKAACISLILGRQRTHANRPSFVTQDVIDFGLKMIFDAGGCVHQFAREVFCSATNGYQYNNNTASMLLQQHPEPRDRETPNSGSKTRGRERKP